MLHHLRQTNTAEKRKVIELRRRRYGRDRPARVPILLQKLAVVFQLLQKGGIPISLLNSLPNLNRRSPRFIKFVSSPLRFFPLHRSVKCITQKVGPRQCLNTGAALTTNHLWLERRPMAAHKRTRSPKRRTSFVRFPEVTGKVVESVEVDRDVEAVTIVFEDKTVLSFILEPLLAIFPELSATRKRERRTIKRWPPLQSKPSIVLWP